MRKQESSLLKSVAVILLPFVTFILGWQVALNSPEYSSKFKKANVTQIQSGETIEEANAKKPYQIDRFDLDVVDEVYELIQEKYVDADALKEPQVEYGLARGLVSALDDPFSEFMTPQENKDFQDGLGGKLEGIGAELTMREGILTVVSPLKNSPASKSGLMPEDIVLEINGEKTEEMSLEQAVLKIRGPENTEVKLKILRKGPEELELTIKRAMIIVDSVTWEMKENKIAYISLNQFGENTTKEFLKILNEVILQEAEGIILDLRFNGGGFLDGAVDVVSAFLKEGKVVTIKKRDGSGNETLNVSGDVKLEKMPLVVLINAGSASASEIVAGAIQDHKRGLILGEQSFGKGTVQEVMPLQDGSSLRLTIAKWFTPNGVNITETGVTPDQKVEMTIDDYKNQKDPQLNAAMDYLIKNRK